MRTGSQETFAGPSDSPRLFSRIARRYDTMNRLMSLGRDRHWRKLTAEALALPARGHVLDVGVGTGDMALAIMKRWPGATVVGVDPTRDMMQAGHQKLEMEHRATQPSESPSSPGPSPSPTDESRPPTG
jgi:ubiquinone/menaquinone biosynthesis C-methylase UbiE